MGHIKISGLLTKKEIEFIKEVAQIFNIQWIEIDGIRYAPPKRTK